VELLNHFQQWSDSNPVVQWLLDVEIQRRRNYVFGWSPMGSCTSRPSVWDSPNDSVIYRRRVFSARCHHCCYFTILLVEFNSTVKILTLSINWNHTLRRQQHLTYLLTYLLTYFSLQLGANSLSQVVRTIQWQSYTMRVAARSRPIHTNQDFNCNVIYCIEILNNVVYRSRCVHLPFPSDVVNDLR